MPKNPPARVLGDGCPPPLVTDPGTGRTYEQPLPDGTTEVCIHELRMALQEISDWVRAISKSLECFDDDLCVNCGGADYEINPYARGEDRGHHGGGSSGHGQGSPTD